MPQEPAYADKRSKDCGAKSASEKAEGTMPSATVRRWGVGSPDQRHYRGSRVTRITHAASSFPA